MHIYSALAGAMLTSFVCATPVRAQTDVAPAAIAPADPAPAVPVVGTVRIPATTPVYFSFGKEINSRTAKIDEMFPITLTQPIAIDGKEVVPVGTAGKGQIVHAAKSGWGGKPGELIVAVRYIEYNGQKIPLRGFRLGMGDVNGGTGDNRMGTALAASMVATPLAFVINGGEKTIQPGTLGNAIVSADTDVPLNP